jgi:hypothetical protein
MNPGPGPAGPAWEGDSRPRLQRRARFRRNAGMRRRAQLIAVDLGTARTRVSLSAADVVLDEPTVLGCDRAGRPVAAGWAAWQMAAAGRISLRQPVQAGVVVDPAGCADLLRLLLAEANIGPISGVAVGVPAVATRRDVLTFASVLGEDELEDLAPRQDERTMRGGVYDGCVHLPGVGRERVLACAPDRPRQPGRVVRAPSR